MVASFYGKNLGGFDLSLTSENNLSFPELYNKIKFNASEKNFSNIFLNIVENISIKTLVYRHRF
jgi:hypothetical protein